MENSDIEDGIELIKDEEEEKEDYIVESIGAFGFWQLGVCIIASMTRYTAVSNILSIIFLTPKTQFRCLFRATNATTDIQNSTCYDDCIKYEYSRDVFEETLISEFDLICERAWLSSFAQTIIMLGFAVGASMFGWISDRYGRRKAFLVANYSNVILILAIPFAPDYWTFNAFRFFVGISSGGVLVVGILFVMENVGSKYREFAGTLALLPDGFSEVILSGVAYYSTSWRMYLLIYSLLSIYIVLVVIALPETPRWLLSRGRADEAVRVLTKAAIWNGMSTDDISENISKAIEDMKTNNVEKSISYKDLFRTKALTLRIICTFVIWTAGGFCNFGINQFISHLGTNIYMAVAVMGIIQPPKLPIAIFFNKIFGRKPSIIGSLFVTCSTMAILIFLDHNHWLGITMGVISFSATCVTFAVIYVYTSELFPTPLRNMAYGLSSMGSKVGAMIAPFVAVLSPHWIPSVFFAVVPFIALLFCFILPETKGKILKDSVK